MILTHYTREQKLTGRRNAAKVADAIEYESIEGLGFYMDAYLTKSNHWCGTDRRHCGAHFCSVSTRLFFESSSCGCRNDRRALFDSRCGARALALTYQEAEKLFTDNTAASRAEAVAALRHYAATGEVCVPGGIS